MREHMFINRHTILYKYRHRRLPICIKFNSLLFILYKELIMTYYYFYKKNGIHQRIEPFEYEIDTHLNPCWDPLTQEQTEFYLEHPTASVREVEKCELDPPYIPPEPPVEPIEQIREEAIMEIDKKARETLAEFVDVLGFCDAVASTIYTSRGAASIYSDNETFKTADDFLRIGKICREKVMECSGTINTLETKMEIELVKGMAFDYFDTLLAEDDSLEKHKQDKIREIEVYDVSENVNGFFLGDVLLWLDKDTRSGLINTLNSAAIVGREQVNIWFSGMYITLHVEEARSLLAALEIYATDCYNVTAQHKLDVMALQTIEEVDAYDVTQDYPERLVFDINKK